MRKTIFLTLFLLVSTIAIVKAQADTCPTTVETALKSVGNLCSALQRNSACYGASLVKSTTVAEPQPVNFFAAPGDYAQLAQFREINPQPLDATAGTFGIAALNLQAKLPDTLPGQGVIFLLLGDARLTNEVPADSTDQTPFQSFYFLPGIGKLNCYQADPMLTIQTPGNVSVTLTLNGVETEMGPSTLLTITPSVCTIHRGYIIQRVGDKTASLLANQTVDIHIESNGTVVVDDARGISQREFDRGQELQDAINTLGKANSWEAQLITAPKTFDTEPATTAAAAGTPSPTPCDTKYTVVQGDTVRKIAQLYGTSVQDIVTQNLLANPNLIFAGQVLCIPNPGSGFKP